MTPGVPPRDASARPAAQRCVRQLGQRRFVVALAILHQLVRARDDLRVDAQTLRKRKGQRLPRRANVELERRREGCRIEANARVGDAGRRMREELQLGRMRRNDRMGAASQQPFEHRDGERGAGARLGAPADLVDDCQRSLARAVDISRMRCRCAEKVDAFAASDCSSPMSAMTRSKRPMRVPVPAGSCMPQ